MTDLEPAPDRLDEVQRLASALADEVLDAQVMGRPVASEQAIALAQAANLMHEYGLEWPPMLEQALHGLADGAASAGAPVEKQQAAADEAGSVIDGLTRFMGVFRREQRQE